MTTLKKIARISGLLYLIMAITGAYGIMYVPSQLIVNGDPGLTVKNILDNEFLFRTGIMGNLICQTVFIFLALLLYRLFEHVNKHLSRTLLTLVIVSVPIAFIIIFNQLYALLLLKEDFMNTFEETHVNASAMALLKMYDYGNSAICIFWGLWLIPFGQLTYKSGFIPKFLGILLILGGISYVIDAFTFILFPDFRSITNILVSILSSIAEISMVFWLLIKGVNNKNKLETINE